MIRAEQVLFRTKKRSLKTKLTDAALARTDTIGGLGSLVAPLANRLVGTPESAPRPVDGGDGRHRIGTDFAPVPEGSVLQLVQETRHGCRRSPPGAGHHGSE